MSDTTADNMTFLQDKLIEREMAKFTLSLAQLNEKCKAAGLTLEFDPVRAVARNEDGGAHRIEIAKAILAAKKLPPKANDPDTQDLLKRDVLHFVRYIQTLADLTFEQEHGRSRKPSASNDPVIFDEVDILGRLQTLFNTVGVDYKIDLQKVMASGPEAGTYRVSLADAIDELNDPQGGGTRPHEVTLSPVYDDQDGRAELLQMAKLAIGAYQRN